MKKILFPVCFMGIFFSVSAQQKVGTVVFERKINMHRMIQDEQMRAMMPEFRTSEHMLLFSDSISVYKLIPEDESPDPFAGGGGGGPRIMMRFGADGGDLYKNLAQSKSIQSSELGGKNFLITDSIRQQPWKLSSETKQILGFNCHKATRKTNAPMMGTRRISISNGGAPTVDTSSKNKPTPKEIEIVAWYADDLISPVGPENYGQLPGVILELNIDNGQTVYLAKDVKKTVDSKELKEPKKGKVVTQQEYMKMMQELMSNQGGPGMMRMRIDN